MDVTIYLRWSAYATIASFIFMVLAFIFRWGFRFRLVGVTSFMTVLTVGIFGLGLGMFDRPAVEGSVRFNRVYDNGANQLVISVPVTVSPTEVEATLKQAANNYFSLGRISTDGNEQMVIRARTLIHPQPGLTKPLYLGSAYRTLGTKENDQIEIKLDRKALQELARSQPA
ncbi:Ycf51 family protein [Synechocystis sp. PCC 7339]|uniref:Ycf51 family protein n=1 Tax=unclassified Synechocystis TaxID=2640012 RepID=UPI001BAF61D6|nr:MULTISPECIES: Ycf51 family protein [unclassified Synechocystis]QUS61708.1 DUF2518 family protein [Synechocystis sp. PCC 7338]UAJ73906.1 Ycf51 family protein [Synechocystis sp. PCC 7339]